MWEGWRAGVLVPGWVRGLSPNPLPPSRDLLAAPTSSCLVPASFACCLAADPTLLSWRARGRQVQVLAEHLEPQAWQWEMGSPALNKRRCTWRSCPVQVTSRAASHSRGTRFHPTPHPARVTAVLAKSPQRPGNKTGALRGALGRSGPTGRGTLRHQGPPPPAACILGAPTPRPSRPHPLLASLLPPCGRA